MQLGERPLRYCCTTTSANAEARAATAATEAAASAASSPTAVDEADLEVPSGWASDLADGWEGCECLLPLQKRDVWRENAASLWNQL